MALLNLQALIRWHVQVLEREDCEKMNMGLYLGVSECSALPPKFIHLTYSPSGDCHLEYHLTAARHWTGCGGALLAAGRCRHVTQEAQWHNCL